MSNESPWRVGRKLGRTVYCGEKFVALFDDPGLAECVVNKMNDDWNGATYSAATENGECLQDCDAAGIPCPKEGSPMPGAALCTTCLGTGSTMSPGGSDPCSDCDGVRRVASYAEGQRALRSSGLAPKVELERVALAIYSHDGGLDDDDHEKFHGARRTPWTALPETERDDYRLMAAAAIEAIRWGSPFTSPASPCPGRVVVDDVLLKCSNPKGRGHDGPCDFPTADAKGQERR